VARRCGKGEVSECEAQGGGAGNALLFGPSPDPRGGRRRPPSRRRPWSSALDPPRLHPLVEGTTVGGTRRRIEAGARAELRNRCGPYLNSGSASMQPGWASRRRRPRAGVRRGVRERGRGCSGAFEVGREERSASGAWDFFFGAESARRRAHMSARGTVHTRRNCFTVVLR
jgi:hypothetical protein